MIHQNSIRDIIILANVKKKKTYHHTFQQIIDEPWAPPNHHRYNTFSQTHQIRLYLLGRPAS